MNNDKLEILKNQKEKDYTYRLYETSMSRIERQLKRLWIALIIAIIAIATTNIGWLIYISQYDFESVDYSQDGQGVNIIGDKNGVSYHGAEVEDQEKDIEEQISG